MPDPRHLAPILPFFILLVPNPAVAQDEPAADELGWDVGAEVSYVQTSGNAEARTLGLGAVVEHAWERAVARLDLGAIRAEAAEGTRRAVGTPERFDLVDPPTRPTAERYHARARYDREIDERRFWHGGAAWERNRFAGVDSRLSAVGGAGYKRETEATKLRLAAGLTFTWEDEVAAEPGTDDSFAGARLEAGYERIFGPPDGPKWTTGLVVDENLDETEDLRATLLTAVAVDLNRRLAFRTSLDLAYDNLPAREAVPLFPADGGPQRGTVRVPLDELDTTLTVALVVDLTPGS